MAWLQSEEASVNLAFLLLTFIGTAVLSGGSFGIASELARNRPTGFCAYLRYARFAPAYSVLYLPLFATAALGHVLGEGEEQSNFELLLFLGFILTGLVALFLAYRLSLAWFALLESPRNLRHSIIYGWRRVGVHAGQFFALFVVTSIPLLGSLALGMASAAASTLFDVVVSPLIVLCWAHAYVSGVQGAVGGPAA